MGKVTRIGRAARWLALPCLLLGLQLAAQPALAQEDPSGEWGPRFDEDQFERIPGPEIGDYLGIPLNDAARLRADSWDASLIELPENQCRAHGADYGWRGPSGLSIWKEVDRASQKVIAYHTHLTAYGAEQTIWMDGRPHPPDYAPHTWQGFSTGEWDGNTLVITTTHLKENWIRRNGIPRSDNATSRVHLLRHGNVLTVAVLVYDPVYLTEPFMRTSDFVYAPRQRMAPWPCEAVNETDRPPGLVPSHLIDANPFLDEFPANYGIPVQATRGGAQTMYPEYQAAMKTLKTLPRPPKKAAQQ